MWKFCLFLLLAASVVTVAKPKPTQINAVNSALRAVVNTCRAETGATEADFEALVRKDTVTSMQTKCLRACLMKQFNMMDENGKFNRDAVLQIAKDFVGEHSDKMHHVKEILDICYDMEVSKNHCEAAEQYGKCASDYVAAKKLKT